MARAGLLVGFHNMGGLFVMGITMKQMEMGWITLRLTEAVRRYAYRCIWDTPKTGAYIPSHWAYCHPRLARVAVYIASWVERVSWRVYLRHPCAATGDHFSGAGRLSIRDSGL